MAETLFRDVLAGYRELHGSDHPHTFDALDNLSRVQAHQGKMAAAECVAREAQMRCAELLGAAHPSSIARTKTLATMLAAQGKYCEAGEIASEVVQRSKQLHGDRQPKESLGVMLRLRDLRMHTIPPDAGVRLVHGQSARREARRAQTMRTATPNHPNHPNKEAKTNEPDAEDRLAASSGFGRDLAPEQLAL